MPARQRLAAVLAVACLGAAPISGQTAHEPVDVHALGPQVGETVPSFSLPDQNGVERSLDQIMGSKGALILFHRSADW